MFQCEKQSEDQSEKQSEKEEYYLKIKASSTFIILPSELETSSFFILHSELETQLVILSLFYILN